MKKLFCIVLIVCFGLCNNMQASNLHKPEFQKNHIDSILHEHKDASSVQKQTSFFQEDENLTKLCQDFIEKTKDLPESQKGRNELKKKLGKEKYKDMVEESFDAYRKLFDYIKKYKKSGVSNSIYKQTKHVAKNLFQAKHIKNMVLRLPVRSNEYEKH